jgi:hypothetical protein
MKYNITLEETQQVAEFLRHLAGLVAAKGLRNEPCRAQIEGQFVGCLQINISDVGETGLDILRSLMKQ